MNRMPIPISNSVVIILVFNDLLILSAGMEGPKFCLSNPMTSCWNGSSTVTRGDVNFEDDDIADQGY